MINAFGFARICSFVAVAAMLVGCDRGGGGSGSGSGGLMAPELAHSRRSSGSAVGGEGALRPPQFGRTGPTKGPAAADVGAAAVAPPPARPPRSADEDPIAAAAADLLERGQPSHWARTPSLDESDLTIRVSSEVRSRSGEVIGLAGFNLRDVHGFRDSPKCNLLVFELAFRAGFVVPLIGRTVGWGFPSSDMIAQDAADGSIFGGWARVRRRPVAAELNLDRENGNALVAVGASAIGGTPGHIAIIDWVDALHLTREGDIRSISFLGWEANTGEGARYSRMTWATASAHSRARFLAVHVIELRAAEPGREVAIIGDGPRRPTEVTNMEGTRLPEGD